MLYRIVKAGREGRLDIKMCIRDSCNCAIFHQTPVLPYLGRLGRENHRYLLVRPKQASHQLLDNPWEISTYFVSGRRHETLESVISRFDREMCKSQLLCKKISEGKRESDKLIHFELFIHALVYFYVLEKCSEIIRQLRAK